MASILLRCVQEKFVDLRVVISLWNGTSSINNEYMLTGVNFEQVGVVSFLLT